MAILNYTTSIAPDKSAGEIVSRLAKHGAARVSIDWDDGTPIAIEFGVNTKFGPREFALPANIVGVQQAIERAWRSGEIPNRYRGREQATKVAWRILKDWVEAQLAIIEAGLMPLDEVMLPYLLTADRRTLAEVYREKGAKALGAGDAPS